RRVRDRLPPALLLHVLLEDGVEVDDHGGEADNLLTVQVDDEPQYSMCRGMVRSEVDGEDVLRRLQLVGELEDARNRRRDARPFVDARPLRSERHYSSPEKRTGSPPIG